MAQHPGLGHFKEQTNSFHFPFFFFCFDFVLFLFIKLEAHASCLVINTGMNDLKCAYCSGTNGIRGAILEVIFAFHQ